MGAFRGWVSCREPGSQSRRQPEHIGLVRWLSFTLRCTSSGCPLSPPLRFLSHPARLTCVVVCVQAIAINQSLSVLGTVISMLTSRRHTGQVPTRSSKLTYLLEDALGGNCYTYMIANVSPAARSYSATLATLEYAARTRLMTTRPEARVQQASAQQSTPQSTPHESDMPTMSSCFCG